MINSHEEEWSCCCNIHLDEVLRKWCSCCYNENDTGSYDRIPITSQPQSHQVRENEAYLKRKLTDENDRYRAEISQKEREVRKLKDKVLKLESKNEELLLRLSASASAKLTDGNPNIADLNDENRPTKLAEQFSELYDNQWTDAFEILRKDEQRPEDDACKLLLTVLISIFDLCHEKAEEDLKKINEALTPFINMDEQSKEIVKTLKDSRKRDYKANILKREKEVHQMLGTKLTDEELEKINAYIKVATRICWLMTIQDPPVYIDPLVDLHKSQFDGNKYRPYTQSGDDVDFIVWPVLYLYKGGNVLSKGVAQGMKVVEQVTEESENARL